MYRVRLIDGAEFREAREAWDNLVAAMNAPSIFCTWEWVYTWWEHFGSSYDPVILFIYDGEELKGILPLARSRLSSNKGVLKGRALSYCGSVELYPDHLDIISDKKDSAGCIKAAFDFLRSSYRGWDVLYISLVSDESGLLSSLNKADFPFDVDIKQASVSPFIELSGGFEAYSNKIDSRIKNTVKRKQKKLLERKIEYVSSQPSQNRESMRALFRLHELRAEKKGIVSTFRGQRMFDFHDSFAERISEQGWLWLRFLRNEEEIISAIYCFAFCGRVSYYQIGLDPEWESFSPGTVLMYELIKEAFSKEFQEFDFLRGAEEYKNSWTEASRPLYSVNVYNNTLQANLSKQILKSKNLIKRTIGKFISRSV